jgi:sensor histidine kinase YesM
MKHLKHIVFIAFIYILSFCCKANSAIQVNTYDIASLHNKHTHLDSSIYTFATYFAYKSNNHLTIEKPYDDKSYRLNKYLLQIIDYTNSTDSVTQLKFYSTKYTFISVGEIDDIIANTITIKSSTFIKSNQQFYEVTVFPKSTLHAYLLYQPISFKDYADNSNALFRYTNPFWFPKFDNNTYKENIGFAILMLFLLGMIFILFIFYGLAYINLKDKIYLSYTAYLFVTFFQVLYMSQYILSKDMMMFNFFGNSSFDECTKGLMIVFYSIFYKQAFEINKEQKVLFFSVNALKIISIVYVLVIAVAYIFKVSWYYEPIFYAFYRFPIFLFSLIVLIYSIVLKTKTAFQKMILFGSLIYTVFTMFTTFQKTDFPVKDLLVAVNGLYLGVALELIVFSIALGLRIRDSYLSTEKLQDKLIHDLQQNEEFIKNENVILEEKVKERVSQINQQSLLIEEQKRQALIQSFEKEKIEIQLLALSSQMNPHFIFNCMNSIQHFIITNDNEKASSMLHNFASLIRMVLENSTEPDISLDNETLLLNTYLKLEQERNNQLFDFDIKIESGLSTDFIKIPIMMIQPFLENVIWHAFKFINYKGYVLVYFSFINNMVCCEITDNGIGRKKAEEYNLRYRTKNNKSIAINIIQDRIDILNQTADLHKASLQIVDLYDEQQQAAGTKIILNLPVL